MNTPDTFLAACRTLIGDAYVLTRPADQAPWLQDWRKRYQGRALAVLRPGTVHELARLVQLCAQHRVAMVPQGGNTGLCGGATPDATGMQVILQLQRLNRIRQIDASNYTLTAEAGCVLQTIQQAAQDAGRLFPLSLAAEGSCTLGGNLATNAGGTAVLRYGNTRELCLGLEVVTPQGEIWSNLAGLRKNNTGYDLRDLFIGAEGTLGVITAATMKLYPAPRAQLTALAAVDSVAAALTLLNLAQEQAGPLLTGFELISQLCMQLVQTHFPQMRLPFGAAHPYYVLLELSDHEEETHTRHIFETLMTQAIEMGSVQDAAVASSIAQSRAFWQLREHIPLAQAAEGKNIKHDIALPISRIADFLSTTDRQLHAVYPHARLVTFGHLGDGNLHYNIAPAAGADHEAFLQHQASINRIVHDSVHAHGGTISAEHGIGQLKRDDLLRYKPAVEIAMMRAIKRALDPEHLLNPGKVLPDALPAPLPTHLY